MEVKGFGFAVFCELQHQGWSFHHPVKDVAAAGRWTSVQTLLTCYQQPDVETLRGVMEEPRRLGRVTEP
jgi:hypothetical protein